MIKISIAKFSFLLTLLLILLIAYPVIAEVYKEELCSSVEEIKNEVVKFKKKKFLNIIKCQVQSYSEIKEFIDSELDTKIGKDKLSQEELFFKAIKFFPKDENYRLVFSELISSEIAAYYNSTTKFLNLSQDIKKQGESKNFILAHEIVHALQDQYFNLTELTNPQLISSDLQMARSAVIEGDAMVVMLQVMFNKLKDNLDLRTISPDEFSKITKNYFQDFYVDSSEEYANLKKLLMFSYKYGLNFLFNYIHNNKNLSVDSLFNNLPVSTSEIMHPSKYLKRLKSNSKENSQSILLEDFFKILKINKLPKGTYKDTYGEFFFKIWLETIGLSEEIASKIAATWLDDLLVIYPNEEKFFWVVKMKENKMLGNYTKIIEKIFIKKSFNLQLRLREGYLVISN